MSDDKPMSGAPRPADEKAQPHYPRHRREDVPVDAEPDRDALLGEFGENPDTSVAG